MYMCMITQWQNHFAKSYQLYNDIIYLWQYLDILSRATMFKFVWYWILIRRAADSAEGRHLELRKYFQKQWWEANFCGRRCSLCLCNRVMREKWLLKRQEDFSRGRAEGLPTLLTEGWKSEERQNWCMSGKDRASLSEIKVYRVGERG